MPLASEVTLRDIEDKIEVLRARLSDDELRYVIDQWEQARFVDLPLDRVDPLFVRTEDLHKLVKQAVSRLLSFFGSPYGGVGIFSIRSPRRAYGTGKSQLAAFIRKELEKQGFRTEYLVVGKEKVQRGDFQKDLRRFEKLSNAVIFVDEIDLLFSPELSEAEQKRLVESFANAVIEYSEDLTAQASVRQALVLILSYKAEQGIETIASSRLGRRLMRELVNVDLPVEERDVRELMATVAALYASYYELGGQALWPLRYFVNDYTGFIWDRLGGAGSIGEIVSAAMKFTRRFCEGLSEAFRERSPNLARVIHNVSLLTPALGLTIEHVIKDVLTRLVPRYEVVFPELELRADCTLVQRSLEVNGSRADSYYSVALGTIEVGKCLVEVTTAQEIDSRKREQIERFVSRYPTLLIHLVERGRNSEWKQYEEEKGNLEVVQVQLEPFKYPAALWELAPSQASQLAYDLAQSFNLSDSIGAFLRKHAEFLARSWLARRKVEESKKAPSHVEAMNMREEALRLALEGFIRKLDFGKYTRRSKSTVRDILISSLKSSFDYLDDATLQLLYDEAISRLEGEKLCRLTKEFVFKTDLWNDKRALEVMYSAIAPRVLGERAR